MPGEVSMQRRSGPTEQGRYVLGDLAGPNSAGRGLASPMHVILWVPGAMWTRGYAMTRWPLQCFPTS